MAGGYNPPAIFFDDAINNYMAKIFEFKLPEPKPPTRTEVLNKILDKDTAVKMVVTELVKGSIHIWVENGWSFSNLDKMVDHLHRVVTMSIPEQTNRKNIEFIIQHLLPFWIEMATPPTDTDKDD